MSKKSLPNKKYFVGRLAKQFKCSKAEAGEYINYFVDDLRSAILTHDGFVLRDLMRAEVVSRPAKASRNPRTGTPVAVPAHRVVKIKPGIKLAAALKTSRT